MENKKIIIAGGSGFIGQELVKFWGKQNQIVLLTRQIPGSQNNRNRYDSLSGEDQLNFRSIKWDGKTVGAWAAELNAADLVINLAGKSVNCRYTKKNKKEIIDSRVNSIEAIGQAITTCEHPPKCWINASSATIYRDATDRPQDEFEGEIGEGFSVSVCQAWEKSLIDQPTPHTRKVALRIAIVLGQGGALLPYFNLLKFGLGGKQGSGRQMFSWIHIEDTCRIIEWLFNKEDLQGVFNCSAPNPVPNSDFMRALRKATHKKFGLPAFEWMLKLGAMLIGTETELILKSRWVIPTKILQSGFHFKFPLLEDALADIVKNVPRKQYNLF